MHETGQVRHDVRTAADRLGISPDGVRKQIRRGKLPAEKIGSQWFVLLPQDSPEMGQRPETGPSQHETGQILETEPARDGTGQRETLPTPTEASRRYLEELRDEWLMPLIKENGDLRERIGRLEERLSIVEQERDEARARLKPIVLTPTAESTDSPDQSARSPSSRWWAFWRR